MNIPKHVSGLIHQEEVKPHWRSASGETSQNALGWAGQADPDHQRARVRERSLQSKVPSLDRGAAR